MVKDYSTPFLTLPPSILLSLPLFVLRLDRKARGRACASGELVLGPLLLRGWLEWSSGCGAVYGSAWRGAARHVE